MPSTLGIVASEAIPHDFVVGAGNASFTNSPVNAWKWNARGASTGWGTKYADPSPATTSSCRQVKIHPSGKAIAMTTYGYPSGPYINVYSFSYSSGWGTRYSNPVPTPSSVEGSGIDFSPDGTNIVYGTSSTPPGAAAPFIHAYPWSMTSGFGTKYAAPVDAPTTTVSSVSFSPDGNTLITTGFDALSGTGNIRAYNWLNSTGFGTMYTGPEEAFNNSTIRTTWSPDGNTVLTSGGGANAGVSVNRAWVWSSGWGSRYGSAAVGGTGYDCDFHPSGEAVGFARDGSPYIKAFIFTTGVGFGTAYTNPATLPAGNPGWAFSWSKRMGNDVAIGSGNSPYIQAYPWSNSTGFGTKYTNPISLPSFEVLSIDWFRG